MKTIAIIGCECIRYLDFQLFKDFYSVVFRHNPAVEYCDETLFVEFFSSASLFVICLSTAPVSRLLCY